MSMCMDICFHLSHFIHIRVKWPNHMVVGVKLFMKLPDCHPKCLHSFACPLAVHGRSRCSSSSPAVGIACDFSSWGGGGREVESCCGLICISLISNNVEHLFMGSLALPTSSLVQRLLGEDLFNRVLCYYWVLSTFLCSGFRPLSDLCLANIFL